MAKPSTQLGDRLKHCREYGLTFDDLAKHLLYQYSSWRGEFEYGVPMRIEDPSRGIMRVCYNALTEADDLKILAYFRHLAAEAEAKEVAATGRLLPAESDLPFGLEDLAQGEAPRSRYNIEDVPRVLTKADYWDKLEETYPEDMARFRAWIDDYKKRPEWSYLFGRGFKFHHMPTAMQLGCFIQWSMEDKFYGKMFQDGPDTMKDFIGLPGLFLTFEKNDRHEARVAGEKEEAQYSENDDLNSVDLAKVVLKSGSDALENES